MVRILLVSFGSEWHNGVCMGNKNGMATGSSALEGTQKTYILTTVPYFCPNR
jgi:hypothetical protein